MHTAARAFLTFLALLPTPVSGAESTAANSPFVTAIDPKSGFITSLRKHDDLDHIEFIRPGSALGHLKLRVRTPGQPWRDAPPDDPQVHATSRFATEGHTLRWTITVKNASAAPVEIGDLALPLPMNTDYVWDHDETFTRRLFKHAFIGGHGSFLYWLPVKGSGTFLVMTPEGDTSLEAFTAENMDYAFGRENFSVFIHSKALGETETRGTWRIPRSSRTLLPGQITRSTFLLRWADSHQGVREILCQSGIDPHVAPGMVVPRDLDAMLALRSRHPVQAVETEFPDHTKVRTLPPRASGTNLYQISFRRLGENLVTVRYADGRVLLLEFFVTEPLETLVKKRAAFIVRNQQHRDPSKWYAGLYSLWDRRQTPGRNLLGPDNPAGQPIYAVSGSDDPSNGKALLIAEKNAAFPDAAEIASLESFVSRFVWGKHQRTDTEIPFPYGIYGADSWHQNRFTDRDPLDQGISRPGGPSACRMWRTFDYPTYFALYFNLYRIAKQRPDLVKQGDAALYLERAYGTARAYFEVPAAIRMEGGWTFTGWVYWQYTIGNFHEKYLLPLIAALEAEGQKPKADCLRAEWEKKVKYFIYDSAWPFASEMPVDSTAYESTYAAANYALETTLRPDHRLWHDKNKDQWFSHPVIDPNRHLDFLRRQHLANLACRGAIEPSYWSLGSDFRGCGGSSYTLSYMSQMGGWAVLDYALRHDPDPAANLRLGYASLLSSWALMNSGDAASDFGHWTPGPLHDGAMSWGFQPRLVGSEWNPAMRDLPRGAWPVCGEADHGLVAGIEAASTILFDDPLFGPLAYGGVLDADNTGFRVIPRDGVRQRFHALLGARRIHIALDRDGFARDQPVRLNRDLDHLSFTLESRAPQSHVTTLSIGGLAPGQWNLTTNARTTGFLAEPRRKTRLPLNFEDDKPLAVSIQPAP